MHRVLLGLCKSGNLLAIQTFLFSLLFSITYRNAIRANMNNIPNEIGKKRELNQNSKQLNSIERNRMSVFGCNADWYFQAIYNHKTFKFIFLILDLFNLIVQSHNRLIFSFSLFLVLFLFLLFSFSWAHAQHIIT